MEGGVGAHGTGRDGVTARMGDELDGSAGSAVVARAETDEAVMVGVETVIHVVCVPAHFWRWGGGEGGEGEEGRD